MPLEDREFQFVYIFSLLNNTQFIRKYMYIVYFFPKTIFWMETIYVGNYGKKSVSFFFQGEIKKKNFTASIVQVCLRGHTLITLAHEGT